MYIIYNLEMYKELMIIRIFIIEPPALKISLTFEEILFILLIISVIIK